MKRRTFYILAFVCFALFVLYTLAVRADLAVQSDYDTVVKLQDHIPASLTPLFELIEVLGRFEITALMLIVICYFAKKPRLIIGILAVFVSIHFFEVIGKVLLTQPGPPFMFHRSSQLFNLPALYSGTESSYPSGHAMRAAYVTGVLWAVHVGKKHMKFFQFHPLLIFLVVISSLVGFSKIVLGQHWPSDVNAGSLLGTSAALLITAWVHDKSVARSK